MIGAARMWYGQTAAGERIGSDPDLFRIRLPFVNLGAGESNCYVLHDAGEWLIVDSGAATERARRILAGTLRSLKVDFSRCTVFLTHKHFDHAGLLGAVLPAHVPLLLSRMAFELRQARQYVSIQQEFRSRMIAMGATCEEASSYAACNAETVALPLGRFAYRFVAEGDEVAVGRLRFRVLGTPGHTPDHLCLWEPDQGILFGGDHMLFETVPSVDAFAGDGDGLALYGRHLRRIADLPVRLLLPGHGECVADDAAVGARIEAILARKRARVEATRDFLGARGIECRFPSGPCGEDVARCVLAQRSLADWRALTPMSRYYYMLEAWVVLRHIGWFGDSGKER